MSIFASAVAGGLGSAIGTFASGAKFTPDFRRFLERPVGGSVLSDLGQAILSAAVAGITGSGLDMFFGIVHQQTLLDDKMPK